MMYEVCTKIEKRPNESKSKNFLRNVRFKYVYSAYTVTRILKGWLSICLFGISRDIRCNRFTVCAVRTFIVHLYYFSDSWPCFSNYGVRYDVHKYTGSITVNILCASVEPHPLKTYTPEESKIDQEKRSETNIKHVRKTQSRSFYRNTNARHEGVYFKYALKYTRS